MASIYLDACTLPIRLVPRWNGFFPARFPVFLGRGYGQVNIPSTEASSVISSWIGIYSFAFSTKIVEF